MTRQGRMAVAMAFAAVALARPASAGDPIFDQSVLHDVRFVMDPNDWKALRANFRSNQYYAANISIDGVVVQQVGVRSRGKGSRSGEKPGLLIDINKYVPNQELRGMKKVILDNVIQDNTFLHEPLAYVVFEAMGIASPQISYTRVTVNDEYWGVYWLVENIGKDFLRARFGEDGGNLFKYEYVEDWRFSDRGSEPARYVPVPFQPETHEDKPDGSGLVAWVQAANSTAEGPAFTAAMGQYMDVTKFVTYLAVENAIAGQDGFVGQQGMNNLYVYQDTATKKFTVIPWDQDTTFVGATWPLTFGLDTNVLVKKLLADPAVMKVYSDAVRTAAERAMNPAVLLPKLEAHYTLMRAAVLTDTKKQYTNEQFELGVQGMRGVITARPLDIQTQTAPR